MPRPPATDEGWYVLHDFRTIDWTAWNDAFGGERQTALEEGAEYLSDAVAVEDAEEGDSAVYSVLGHDADLLVLHLRPTLSELNTLERQFEHTALADFTERTASYVSVTEASGYTGAEDYFDPDAEADPGIKNYIESRLYPELPDAGFVSFYPMDKRRGPDHNWYDLPFEERAEYMDAHGEIGRKYGDRVSQIISGSVGLDDFEWGITLFADDPTDVKELLYEMRFDPSSSRFAEFGPFYSGQRFPPEDLSAFLAGEPVPTDETADDGQTVDEAITAELDRLDAAASASGHAVLVQSTADAATLRDEVDGLRGNFDHYDTHRGTTVYADGDESAVVSVWETERAAETASGFLEELDGAGEPSIGYVEGDGEHHERDGQNQEGEADAHGHDGGEHQHGDHHQDSQEDEQSSHTTDHHDGGHGRDEDRQSGDEAGHGEEERAEEIRETLRERGIYAGQPRGEDVYALVLYSEAHPSDLENEVSHLSDGFDRYDTHVKTALYETDGAEPAVVSIWETQDAAETASDYLEDLPGIVRKAGDEGGFGTMGMFYTVKPEYREEFVEKFADVEAALEGMDGHRETDLYANRDQAEDMFIASQWDTKEDCLAFFRSDSFRDTVDWGRDVLADRPRHVFLA